MRRLLFPIILVLVCLGGVLRAAEVIPPPPTKYFNDYANMVQPSTAAELNQKLEQFERDTSNQIVVAIYPKMQSDSSIDDYTVRVAQAWQVGQKVKKNGVVLFVFQTNRTMCIQTGYGLEGALPDVVCKRIIEDEIKPHFKQNDFDGGLIAGVNAILAATKGEYKGGGAIDRHMTGSSIEWLPFLILLFIVIVAALSTIRRGTAYNSYSQSSMGWRVGGAILNMLVSTAISSGSSRGGWSSSGGGSDSGGGGFSAGGGSFGGGGASGSW